jgi:hypothetical protein
MFEQQSGDFEAIFGFCVRGYYWTVFLKCVTRRRVPMRAESGLAHHAWAPVHAGANQHGVAVRKELEHLDEFNAGRLGNQFRCLLQKGV